MPKPNPTGRTRQRPGQLRIIAGDWRGRRLPVMDAPGLRPTPDRIRETLFNWLAPVLPGASCLDLFAGSGALGLEALSRGAGYCRLVEQSPPAATQLRSNLQMLGAEARAWVECGDALALLGRPADRRYDVIFLDPPFRQQLLVRCLPELVRNGWLADEAWIYVESGAEEPLPEWPQGWRAHREKIAGQVSYRLLRS